MSLHSKNQLGLLEAKKPFPYAPAHEVFAKLYRHYPHHFLLESKQVSLFSGRFSVIGIDPVLKVSGKDNRFSLQVLNPRGNFFLDQISGQDMGFVDEIERAGDCISGTVEKDSAQNLHTIQGTPPIPTNPESAFVQLEEKQRTKKKNVAQVIRTLLEKFRLPEKSLLGLYGAFSYDFIRLFEDLQDRLPENNVNDFTLFLYDTFLFFDHIRQESSMVHFREKESELSSSILQIEEQITGTAAANPGYKVTEPKFSLSQKEFEALVKTGQQYIREGEFVQVVFSNILKARFEGDPFALYLKYRDSNPSPYLFYYNFGDEQLVGASPEMMVRCEQGKVHLRPIAGTIRRGADPVEDHDLMRELLNNPKERAELDMLVDLGRSDLSRICKPKIKIDDYRFVERYSRVMHTVTHLSGELESGYTGLDALISCLNAGTLTGAPKVAAMRTIERHELERRGYYGGAFGQLTFSGEVDTTIIIRTAHVRDGEVRYQSGAGIVYDSDPTLEYQETMNKAQAFLETISS